MTVQYRVLYRMVLLFLALEKLWVFDRLTANVAVPQARQGLSCCSTPLTNVPGHMERISRLACFGGDTSKGFPTFGGNSSE